MSVPNPNSASRPALRRRMLDIVALLTIANVGAWAWALTAFRDYPLLLGTALLAYGFGLRHAVDADHLAAIDNVTRKLMQQGERPAAVGLFFSLGHSSIVMLASLAVAVTAGALRGLFDGLSVVGGLIGTSVSALFLFAIAVLNMFIMLEVYRTFREVQRGTPLVDASLDLLLSRRGLLGRLYRPLFGLIRHSWQMYPLGFLFGLGFDTATEIGLLGISATQASSGLSIWSILIFPTLFTAGMALVDTLDNALMLGAYGWAFVKPVRKLYYNMTITGISVLAALLIGSIEALGLIGKRLGFSGAFWNAVGALNGDFGALGYAIVGLFALSWGASMLFYRLKGYDRLDIEA